MAIKVIQWATGPVGRSALRHIIHNPDLELVGLLVYTDEKLGLDAGAIVGLPGTGVTATTDKDAIRAMDADVVVYMPRMPFQTADMDEDVLALLRSGKNVVTPTGYWYPPLYGADYVATIEDACTAGGTSVFGAGDNPGFFFARLGTAATAACSEISSIRLTEFIDGEKMSPTMVFDIVGFGRPVEELEANTVFTDMLDHCYKEDLALNGAALGAEIDDFSQASEYATLDHDLELDIGRIPAGTCVAQRHRWAGLSRGTDVMSITNTWSVTRDIPGWEVRPNSWTVRIEGRPSLTIDVLSTTTLEPDAPPKYGDTNSTGKDAITAMTLVNAIPRVCAAPPGIVYPERGDIPVVQWTHLRGMPAPAAGSSVAT